MNILLLAGSPSTPSRSTRLLHHVGERLALLGHRYVKLHVRDLPAQALVHADFNDEVLRVAREQVAQADAVVIATPVYKAAYSGILKAFLDLLPQDGLRGKLVLPLATGGSQSHMLALDYGLQINWSAEQGLTLDPAIAKRVSDGIENLSASLSALNEVALNEFDSIPFSSVRCSV
jgi:FMN reductase